MAINGARSPLDGKQGEPAVKTSVESSGDTPMAETPQPHRLPVHRQTAIHLVALTRVAAGAGDCASGVWKQQWKHRR